MRRVERVPRMVTVACALVVAATAAIASDPSIRILKPRHRSTAVGPTTISLSVAVAAEELERVEVRVDGDLIAVLDGPPWETPWDAGDGTAHRIEAILRLTDGTSSRAVAETSALRVDEVEKVDLVNLYAVVRDRAGNYVTDLTAADFAIREDGAPQRVERFSTTRKPLRLGLVLDASLSMRKGERLVKAKQAALDFLDVLATDDQATVVRFSDRVELTERFTNDPEALAGTIRKAEAHGGTALYDAVWKTGRMLDGFDGRRVMVLLSDGRDEAANGLEPGSLHTLEEALDEAVQNEVMIFSIGLGKNLEQAPVLRWSPATRSMIEDRSISLADVLRRFAESTGGRYVPSQSAGRLRRSFEQIAEDLRHQYSIAYVSSNTARDGSWRALTLDVPGRDVEVVTRKGYYAPRGVR